MAAREHGTHGTIEVLVPVCFLSVPRFIGILVFTLCGSLCCRESTQGPLAPSIPPPPQRTPLPPRMVNLPARGAGFGYYVTLRDEYPTDLNAAGWRSYGQSTGGVFSIAWPATEVMIEPFEYHASFLQWLLYKSRLRKTPPVYVKCVPDLSFLTALGPDEIQGLCLSECRITREDMANLARLTTLRHLYLGSTNVEDGWLAKVAELKNLRTLDLFGTKITDRGLARLKGMTSLRMLVLSHTLITDEGLAHVKDLTSLRRLDLNGTQITDAGLAHLRGMASLWYLRLDSTAITDKGLVHLKVLPSLGMLDLSSCKNITDAGLVHLREMTHLESLSLQGTSVTEKSKAALREALPKCSIGK